MATPIRIPHWLTLVLNMATQNQTAANVFSYDTNPDVTSIPELINIGNAWITQVLPSILTCCSSALLFTSVSLRTNYPGVPQLEVTIPLPPGTVGTNASDQEAENVAEVVSWRTGVAGRSFRGRTFFAGAPETTILGSTITNAQLANLATAAAHILDFAGSLLTITTLSVASRKLLILTHIFTAIIDIFTNSQRDRLPGHRRRDIH